MRALGNAVIVAHCPFHQRKISLAGALRDQTPDQLVPRKEQVEVARGNPQHALVKDRIDVVRPTLACLHTHATEGERAHKAAGDGGLADVA